MVVSPNRFASLGFELIGPVRFDILWALRLALTASERAWGCPVGVLFKCPFAVARELVISNRIDFKHYSSI